MPTQEGSLSSNAWTIADGDRRVGEAIVEDPRTPVPDQVAFRIDFPKWLDGMPRRNRKIAAAFPWETPRAKSPSVLSFARPRQSDPRRVVPFLAGFSSAIRLPLTE